MSFSLIIYGLIVYSALIGIGLLAYIKWDNARLKVYIAEEQINNNMLSSEISILRKRIEQLENKNNNKKKK